MVSEQDKQQLGEGSTNYVDAAQKTVKAIQEVGKAAAEKTTLAASEAAANATAAVAQAGLEGGKAVSEVAAGTAAGGPWGAILAAAWALRKPLFKVLICIGLVILFFIIAVVALPSIISNNLFHTDVIISNTSGDRGDHFWDNGEANLLKALVLYVDHSTAFGADRRNLPEVYRFLTQTNERQLSALFDKLPMEHPARAPYNLFRQSSDTVRSGILLGLGTRLQTLQSEQVKRILSRSDIDLTAPAQKKCAYFVILDDQNSTMNFLSSLFFSFLFIRLTRFADTAPGGRCPVPVNFVLDEFANIGTIGGNHGRDFARSAATLRSRAVTLVLALQSLPQLQNRYGNNLWAEIMGCCDTQLMLGCSDDVTATYISTRSGDMTIDVNSTMTTRQTFAVAQVIPQYRYSEGIGKRRLLTPDEVLRLPQEDLLVAVRGQKMLRLRKLDYTRLPAAKHLRPCSILDYGSGFYSEPMHSPYEQKPAYSPLVPSVGDLYETAAPPENF